MSGLVVEIQMRPEDPGDRGLVHAAEEEGVVLEPPGLSISWTDDTMETGYPDGWVCPACGGTDFGGVHPDYPQDFTTPAAP